MNIIVIDTCVFEDTKDYFFKKPKLRLIKDLNKYGIYIPNVVIEEITSHLFDLYKNINDKIESFKDKLSDKYRNLSEYDINAGTPNITFDSNELLKQCNLFRDKYIKSIKKENINIQDFPKDFSVSKIFKRIFERKYPFKVGSDKGIKDYAIWESVIEIMKSNKSHNVIFITENSKDFLENGNIPEDFKKDLLDNNLDVKKLQILSLKDYLEQVISIPPEELFNKLKNEFIPKLETQKYCQHGYPLSFGDFLMEDSDFEDLIGITPIFGYTYDFELTEYNIKPETLKCVDIENDDLYIELGLTISTNMYVEEMYVGDIDFNILISVCYDSENNEITGIEVTDISIIESRIDENKVYDAECIAHAEYVSSRDRT